MQRFCTVYVEGVGLPRKETRMEPSVRVYIELLGVTAVAIEVIVD